MLNAMRIVNVYHASFEFRYAHIVVCPHIVSYRVVHRMTDDVARSKIHT